MKVPLYRRLFSPLRKIINSVLITSFLLSFVVVGLRNSVLAQSPDYTVYLPLVSKNYQEWLDIFNQYRKVAGLNPVVANDSMNDGLGLHTNYMLLNPTQDDWHTEYEGKPGYTAEGKLAASQSNMLWSNDPKYTDKQAIDLWMKTERHRYHMLNPYLVQTGFSLDCEVNSNEPNCFAGLNIYGGIDVKGGIIDVVYPAENQSNFPRSGFPITWGYYPYFLINSFGSPSVTLYDSSNNPVGGTVNYHSDHVKEVVFMPNNELLANHRYKIVIQVKVDGVVKSKTWYFTTASN